MAKNTRATAKIHAAKLCRHFLQAARREDVPGQGQGVYSGHVMQLTACCAQAANGLKLGSIHYK